MTGIIDQGDTAEGDHKMYGVSGSEHSVSGFEEIFVFKEIEKLVQELVMMSISKCKMEDLPKELVISILLRLPAEDLRRCKGVCKSLYSIITSRPFIEVRRKIRNSYILVKYEDLISSKHVISLLCDETLEVVYTQTILSDTPLMDSMSSKDRVVKVVGCCNGVVCLRRIDMYVLWNPATRDAKIIPDGLYKSNPDKKMFQHREMGFGFDPKNNDYKLVSIQRLFGDNRRPVRPCQQEVEVYSLKAGCWKLLPGIIPTCDIMSAYSVEGCNGGEMISWLVWNEEYGEHVMSFDISNEVFITTPLPPFIIESSSDGNCRNSLMFHNASLALDHYVKDRKNQTETHNIWVLGEYGVKESWTNLFIVGPFKLLGPSISGFWNNNKVLLEVHGGGCRHDLILVDPSIRKIKDLDIHGTSLQVFNYQENLVQINATPPINLF
ncbi:F-box/kelch-repeat protein At3g06240-like isoform X1 [Ziziphus jujuba]|uniref:F-box/kelch-repeat protein At3g06240-like isoform X1 n=3 Tax=Ziziphus jujuba TaxID=326968 RepID=A0ABM3ZVA1_ZIZJJ|nr:F-box/kelch-repeat protein At3g06240-like isoform X1 [Ziziphus jujuba]